MPAMLGADDPPGPERAGQLEGEAARRARDRPRRLARVLVEGDVDVVGGPFEQLVAHGAAYEPRLTAGQHLPRRFERRPHRYSLGTRAEIPQVTS